MRHPQQLVGWLYDVVSSLDWHVSILDILETEDRYPGLMDDLALESWQRRLVKDQLDSTNKMDDETGDLDE